MTLYATLGRTKPEIVAKLN